MDLLSHVDAMISAEKYHEALNAVECLVKAEPDNYFYYIKLAEIYLATNKLDEAVSCYKFIAKNGVLNTEFALKLIRLLYDVGRIYDAEYLVNCIIYFVDSADAYYFKAKILKKILPKREGNHESRICYEKAIALAPGHLAALNELVLIYIAMGAYEKAIFTYKKIIATDSDNPEPYYALSELLAHIEMEEEARRYLKQGTERENDVNSADFRLRIAEINEFNSVSVRAMRNRYPSSYDMISNTKATIIKCILGDYVDMPDILNKNTSISIIGSCFAGATSEYLNNNGYKATYVPLSEHLNSTFVNKILIEHTTHKLYGAFSQNNFQNAITTYSDIIENMTKIIDSNIIILNLGITPCFFDHNNNFVLPQNNHLNIRNLATKYLSRMTNVDENKRNIIQIIKSIQAVNKNCMIVLTVSPTPLLVAFNSNSSVMTDCISKSTLRIAIHEIMEMSFDKVFYWPSFEIVRWLGGHIGQVFGKDDGSALHVNDDLIRMNAELFVDVFSGRLEV